ncbi:MAG: hypothetical protein ACMUIG_03205 [Thermoplasmatota archaeon]
MMNRRINAVMMVLAASALILITSFQGAAQSATAVKDGDPLDIYLRKSGTPRIASMKLYPSFYPEQENTTEFVQVLEPRGSDNDRVEMFLPRSEDENDNSFKYRPNGSVQGRYSFHISCSVPNDVEVTTYTLRVLIEMDYERGSEFQTDDEYHFDVVGPSDGQARKISGEIDMNPGDFESFSGQKGGRIKVTLIKEDFSDTRLTIYMGYLNKTSHFTLPFSRFSADAAVDDDNNGWTILIIAGVIAVLGVVGYVLYDQYRKTASEKLKKEEEERSRSKRKGRRRGGR